MNAVSRHILPLFAFVTITALSGCVVPTVSLHSFREVSVTITEANSGTPVALVPFRVHYEYSPADSPIVYHLELRTPKEVQATTDANGQAVIKLADYAWTTALDVDDKQRGYFAEFVLSKEVIRKGGRIEPRYPLPQYPKLRLEIDLLKRPNRKRNVENAGAR
jgi:hypothetical protein